MWDVTVAALLRSSRGDRRTQSPNMPKPPRGAAPNIRQCRGTVSRKFSLPHTAPVSQVNFLAMGTFVPATDRRGLGWLLSRKVRLGTVIQGFSVPEACAFR